MLSIMQIRNQRALPLHLTLILEFWADFSLFLCSEVLGTGGYIGSAQ